MKPWLAVMAWTAAGRIAKYQDFDTEAEAQAFVAANAERYPKAFVAPNPGGSFGDWLIDGDARTAANEPPPPPVVPYRDARAADYITELSDGRPTFQEAIGDLLDDLLSEVAALRASAGGEMTAGLAGKMVKIQAVKERFPKP